MTADEGRTLNAPAPRTIRVWDAPVRVFHWLMVASFALAWLTAESERWRLVHVTLGYTMAGLVAFRLLWGVAGTRHARFAAFVRGPAAVGGYLRSLLRGRPAHYTGHNPAGSWAIVALLLLAALTTALGWAAFDDIGGEAVAEAHEALASAMLVVVAVHVAGVLVGSLCHRENLVRAMVTGRKTGDAAQDNGGSRTAVAALLLAAVLSFWIGQWLQAPGRMGYGGASSNLESSTMAKPNYQFEKRQRELAKKKKKEEKAQRKATPSDASPAAPSSPAAPAATEGS